MAEQLTQQDVGMLESFRQKAIEFRDAFFALEQTRDYAMTRPELREEYEDLYGEGSMIKSTVEYITRTVDAVTGFFSNAWSSATGTFKRWFGLGAIAVRPAPGLGVIPIVAGATIAGAVALMAKWVKDVYLFERKVAEQQRLEAEGLTPQAAAAQIARVYDNGGGILGEILGDMRTPLLLAGGGFLVWHFFLRGRSNGN